MAPVSCSQLTGAPPSVVLCCRSPSASRADVLFIQGGRWRLFESLLPSGRLRPGCPFSSDPWQQRGAFSERAAALQTFPPLSDAAVAETLRQACPSFTNHAFHPAATSYMPKYKADWGYLHGLACKLDHVFFFFLLFLEKRKENAACIGATL